MDLSKYISSTATQGRLDATSTPERSHEAGSEECAQKMLDELQATHDVHEPSDWLPWDVTWSVAAPHLRAHAADDVTTSTSGP